MSKDRFAFGKNWKQFLKNLDDEKIEVAVQSLRDFLDTDNLEGKTFLDIGSGSGLFSLAARKLGASVHSFDYDKDSVICTKTLRKRYFPGDKHWVVGRGDALDKSYMEAFPPQDIVYSWGVLHHTGDMYTGIDNAARLVKPGGKLFLAIYNDQGTWSRGWKAVKKTYNALPARLRFLVLFPCMARLWGPVTVRDFLRLKPFHTWKTYQKERGMSPWRDVVDWVGGLPFEVATPEAIFDFCRERGFRLEKLVTCGGGSGCNQYVFTREA